MPKERKPPSLRDQALAYLARREHSRAELSRKLEQAGHEPEDIALLLDEFENRNWLSDHRFAESYVADHRARNGVVKLSHELRQRGVPETIVEEVLAGERKSELLKAKEVWSKKFGALPETLTERAKQIRFLQSRGFTSEVIRALMNNPVQGESGDL